jgi:lantibiotic modifying enzyme
MPPSRPPDAPDDIDGIDGGSNRYAVNVGLSVTSLLIACACGGNAGMQADRSGRLLDHAIDAGVWIRASAIAGDDGTRWPADPARPESVSTDLYSGSPGVILFSLELHRATHDARWLDDARRGAHALIADVAKSPDAIANSGGGLYVGLAGAAFTLHKVFEATNEQVFLDGANRGIDRIIDSLRANVAEQPAWTRVNDIIGGLAGSGLFLLYAAEHMNRADALDAARQCGDILLERAIEKQAGLMWAMSPDVKNTYPNFSHGTAGVAYFLTALHAATGEQKYLEGAIGGATYLLQIAETTDGACRIPRFDPDEYAPEEPQLFYVSWCHGPAGTGRLFDLLHEVTGEPRWATARDRLAAVLLDEQLLTDASRGDLASGFWNNVGRCCGNAGVGQFMLLMHDRTGEAKYLDFARRVTDDLLARGRRDRVPGLRWPHAEHRIQPGNVAAQTGLMQGAAGIGLWLLELEAAELGREFSMRLPDEIQPSRPAANPDQH